MKVSKVKDL